MFQRKCGSQQRYQQESHKVQKAGAIERFPSAIQDDWFYNQKIQIAILMGFARACEPNKTMVA
jgi:hypothetical protein